MRSPQTSLVRRAATRTFWERLQEAMRDAGMKPTQTGAGKLIGVSQPSVNDWTLGGSPSMDNACALAKALNVNVEWLLTERGPKRSTPQDAHAEALWELWPHLDLTTKIKLVRMAGEAYGLLQRGSEATAKSHQRA